MPAKIIIVDEKDNQIGVKEAGTLDNDTDIYRVSALWITNSKGQFLLAKRALTKKQNPGKWGPAAAGTVEEGETYDSNIIKEAEEEIDLKNIKPEKWIKNDTLNLKYKHFTQWYKLKLDKDIEEFKIESSEVAEIKWFTKEEILKIIENDSDEVIGSVKEMIKNGEFGL